MKSVFVLGADKKFTILLRWWWIFYRFTWTFTCAESWLGNKDSTGSLWNLIKQVASFEGEYLFHQRSQITYHVKW